MYGRNTVKTTVNPKANLITAYSRVINTAVHCGGCYLRHWDTEKASSSCGYCFSGKILLPNTLVLPPVWSGINALSVFSAINKLPMELLEGAELKIDFSEVEYLDSSGLGALVGLQKQLREHGTKLHLIVTDANILRLLSVANLNKILKIN